MEIRLNKVVSFFILSVMVICFLSCSSESDEKEHVKLWYDQPAEVIPNERASSQRQWLSGLPLGNGSLGLMVFGDVNLERIQLNEETMWSGKPADTDNPDAPKALDKIRQLLWEGKYREATELTNETQVCLGVGSGRGGPFGSFQTLGDLWIDNGKDSDYQNYYRELDMNDAVARVRYTQDGVNYSREVFSSQPDQVMVARFTADQPGKISFTVKMDRPDRFNTYSENDHLVMRGALAEYHRAGDVKVGDYLQYMSRLKAVNTNGTVSYTDSTVIVKDADEVILFLSASTDYVLDYPKYKGRDYENLTASNLEKAVERPYKDLLKRHLDEYRPYFSRLSFNLTPDTLEKIPTNVRLNNFKQGQKDLHLVELIFQYGRYLLITSSRPGTMPANLQGMWADLLHSPWNGDYHTDINIQMNYWPAGVTNLSEFQLPMFDLMESLVKPGERTASIQYNHKGWVVHPITNVWGFTSPGEVAAWGMHLGAGAWLLTHVWDHYQYTHDKAFLERMFPVMVGSAQFYLDWLVEHPQTGKLVSGPAVSPENTFTAPDGSRSQISMGPAHDQQVIHQFFKEFLYVADALEIQDEIVNKVAEAKNKLASGTVIASDGRLMEWPEEFPEVEPGHRHISHLFALHPGNQITMEETPELAAAVKKSLDYRIENGIGHTQAGTFGWSAAWLISQYARLYEAEKAKESLNTILSGGVAPNLFGLHPPFQIDANFGTTAGIAEMVLQSHTGAIHLLPALPKSWPYGDIKGLRARGGYDVDIQWENNELTQAIIGSDRAQTATIRYKGKEITVDLKKGKKQTIRLTDF